MAHRIIGLDLGAHMIKALVVDPKNKHRLVTFEEEPVIRAHHTAKPAAKPDASPAPPSAEPPESSEAIAPGELAQDEQPEALPPREGGLGDEDTTPDDAVEDDALSLDDSLAWTFALERLLARLGDISQDSVVTFLPNEQALTLQLETPLTDVSKVRMILPGLLEDQTPLSMQEAVHDFCMIERAATEEDEEAEVLGGGQALVGLARNRDMAEFLRALNAQGVDPALITVPELMLEFAAEFALEDHEEGTWAVLDLGHETTRLLVKRDGALLAARSIGIGGARVTEALAEALHISWGEAEALKHRTGLVAGHGDAASIAKRALRPLLRDLRRTFRALYADQQAELETIYVCGGTSHMPGLIDLLTSEFGVAVKPLPGVHGDAPVPMSPLTEARVALAHALAAHPRLDRQHKRQINLRQGPFLYHGRSSFVRAQLVRLAVAAVALAVLSGGVLVMKRRDLTARKDAMRAAVTRETKKVFGRPIMTAKKIEQQLTSQETSQGSFVPKVSSYDLMYQLVAKVNANTQLTLKRFEVDVDRHVIQIYGTTSNPQAVDSIVSDLEKLKCLKDIRKDKLQVRKEDEATFELQISSGCS